MTLNSPDVEGFAESVAELLREERLWKDMAEQQANFWDVVEYGSESYETRYSRMLRWLLDPSETHGLGSYFVDLFARKARFECGSGLCPHGPFAFDREETVARAEVTLRGAAKGKDRRRIDLVIEDRRNRVLIVVENKVGAVDSDDQLADYYRWTSREQPAYADHCRGFVFLTMGSPGENGEWMADAPVRVAPGDAERWSNVSYLDLEPMLEGAILRAIWNGDRHTRKIVEDFYFDLQRMRGKREDNYLTPLFEDGEPAEGAVRGPDVFGGFSVEIALLAKGFSFRMIEEGENGRPSVQDPWAPLVGAIEACFDEDDAEEFLRRFSARVEALLNRAIERSEFRRLAEVLWEARPRRRKKQDNSSNPVSQKFMRMFFNGLVAEPERLQLERAEEYGRERTATVVDARFVRFGIDRVRISGGGRSGGQAVKLFFGATGLDIYLATSRAGEVPAVAVWEVKPEPEHLVLPPSKERALLRKCAAGSLAGVTLGDEVALEERRADLEQQLLAGIAASDALHDVLGRLAEGAARERRAGFDSP